MKPEAEEWLASVASASIYAEKVEFEGGRTAIIKAVTAQDAIDFRARLKELQDAEDPNLDVRVMALAVARTLHNAEGVRLFGDDDMATVIARFPIPLLTELGQKALALSGMATAPAADHMGKSSPAPPSSESPTE